MTSQRTKKDTTHGSRQPKQRSAAQWGKAGDSEWDSDLLIQIENKHTFHVGCLERQLPWPPTSIILLMTSPGK